MYGIFAVLSNLQLRISVAILLLVTHYLLNTEETITLRLHIYHAFLTIGHTQCVLLPKEPEAEGPFSADDNDFFFPSRFTLELLDLSHPSRSSKIYDGLIKTLQMSKKRENFFQLTYWLRVRMKRFDGHNSSLEGSLNSEKEFFSIIIYLETSVTQKKDSNAVWGRERKHDDPSFKQTSDFPSSRIVNKEIVIRFNSVTF